MRSMKSILKTVLFFLICFGVLAQTPTATPEPEKSKEQVDEEFRQSLLEKIKKDREVIENLLGGGLFKQFDKKLEEMLKHFDSGFYKQFDKDFEKFFDDENFEKMFKNANPHQFMDKGEMKWMETPKERILILKLEMAKDAPMDIRIEKGKIFIKGKVVKGTREVEVEREVSIPRDVHGDQAKFENEEGRILIKLPKKSASATERKQLQRKQLQKKLKPLKRRQGEPEI